MKVLPLFMDGAAILEPKVYGDHRGYFMESYNEQVLHEQGIQHVFIQDNQSLSVKQVCCVGFIISFSPKHRLNW